MVYVEWLRVRRALIVVAWILGILFGLSVVARVAMNPYMNGDDVVSRVKLDPGTRTHEATLSDGTQRITLDDPDGTHVVIDDRGYGGKIVTVREPNTHQRTGAQHIVMGSVSVNETTEGAQRVTVIRTNEDLPLGMLCMFGIGLGILVATILAGSFAAERDGHLEYAFTRPASRTVLALQTMLADIAGIAIAIVAGTLASLAMLLVWQVPHLQFTGLFTIVNGFVVCVAWYAFLAAATASLRRGYAIVLGLSIPAFFLVMALGAINAETSVGQAVHAIFHTLSYLFPMLYISPDLAVPGEHIVPFDLAKATTETLIAAGLAVVYAAATTLQWRRLQA